MRCGLSQTADAIGQRPKVESRTLTPVFGETNPPVGAQPADLFESLAGPTFKAALVPAHMAWSASGTRAYWEAAAASRIAVVPIRLAHAVIALMHGRAVVLTRAAGAACRPVTSVGGAPHDHRRCARPAAVAHRGVDRRRHARLRTARRPGRVERRTGRCRCTGRSSRRWSSRGQCRRRPGRARSPGPGWQVPALPATAHEEQLGQLADPQQTPSTQLPLVHSAPATHASPLGFSVQEPDRQNSPAVQSASAGADRQAGGRTTLVRGAHAGRRLVAAAVAVAVPDRRVRGAAARRDAAAGAGGGLPAGAVAVARADEAARRGPGAAAVRLDVAGGHRAARPREAGDRARLAVPAARRRAADAVDAVVAVALGGGAAQLPQRASCRTIPRCRRCRARSRRCCRRRRCTSCRCTRRRRRIASPPRVHTPLPLQVRGRVAVGGLAWTGRWRARTGRRRRTAGSRRCRRRSPVVPQLAAP